MAKWNLNLENLSLGGFAPSWFKETYPSYGNKNQAGAMVNIDMTGPSYITQGPGLATLTGGTEAGSVTTLIKGMLEFPADTSLSFGVGGNKLYKFSSSAVTSDASYPHTIDKAAVTAELGEDVAFYNQALYYSYNHSGSAGDIGKDNLSGTFDDDWGSTVPTGAAALQGSVPHPMVSAGNDTLYIGNGRYVASYNGTTFVAQALDLPDECIIQDVEWNSDRLWIAAINQNVGGLGAESASIFIWDGTTDSWETEIRIIGSIGGMRVKNGVLFFFYQDASSNGVYKLAYINGISVVDLCSFQGGLPAFYQNTDYKDFILWSAGGLLYAFGSGDKDLPARLFQLGDGGFSTVGGVCCSFGTPIIASTQSTSYKLAAFSGYDTTSSWKSLLFDITGNGKVSRIDAIRVNFETLASGASVALSLKTNQGKTLFSDTISYSKLGAATTVWLPLNGIVAENFRVELDFATGSTTNPVKIKNIRINGSTD